MLSPRSAAAGAGANRQVRLPQTVKRSAIKQPTDLFGGVPRAKLGNQGQTNVTQILNVVHCRVCASQKSKIRFAAAHQKVRERDRVASRSVEWLSIDQPLAAVTSGTSRMQITSGAAITYADIENRREHRTIDRRPRDRSTEWKNPTYVVLRDWPGLNHIVDAHRAAVQKCNINAARLAIEARRNQISESPGLVSDCGFASVERLVDHGYD